MRSKKLIHKNFNTGKIEVRMDKNRRGCWNGVKIGVERTITIKQQS